jgi:outer membrane murein-binding lipoprotein Lpp
MKAVQALIAMLMVSVAGGASAADDYKVIKLEQDVRRLEQQVRDLSREIADLRRQAGAPTLSPPRDAEKPAPSGSSAWLQARNWQRLRVGMSELEVIDALGPPTSTRLAADGTARILFYALEIDTGSFLGGSVELRDRRVVEINTPVLK